MTKLFVFDIKKLKIFKLYFKKRNQSYSKGAYNSVLAERGGFEPPVLSHTRFPSVHNKPL